MSKNPYESENSTLDNELRASLNKDQAKLVFDWIVAGQEKFVMTQDDHSKVHISVTEERFKSLFHDPSSFYREIGCGQFQPVTKIDEDHGGRYIGITSDQALSIFVIMRSLMKEGQAIDDQNKYFISELFKFADYDTYWNLFRDTINEFINVYDFDSPTFTKEELPSIIQKIMDYRQPRGIKIGPLTDESIKEFQESIGKMELKDSRMVSYSSEGGKHKEFHKKFANLNEATFVSADKLPLKQDPILIICTKCLETTTVLRKDFPNKKCPVPDCGGAVDHMSGDWFKLKQQRKQEKQEQTLVNARCPLCLFVDRTSEKNLEIGFTCSECIKMGNTVYMELNTEAWDVIAKERRELEYQKKPRGKPSDAPNLTSETNKINPG